MKTTIDHLLTPRFEVIADYPGTMRNIGSVIDSDYTFLTHSDKGYPAQFPHLFRPLQWWEKRSAEDMPKYLKIDNELRGKFWYFELVRWEMGMMYGVTSATRPGTLEMLDILRYEPDRTYQPCSEEEYLANQ